MKTSLFHNPTMFDCDAAVTSEPLGMYQKRHDHQPGSAFSEKDFDRRTREEETQKDSFQKNRIT